MYRMMAALVFSLAVVLLLGGRFIAFLRKLHFKQTIYELGPAHQQKQGTPIMGGLLVGAATVAAALLFHPARWYGFWDFTVGLILLAVCSSAIGFADDYIKAVKKRNMGLNAKQKLAGQVVVSLAFALYCYFNPQVGPRVIVPFFNVQWDLGIFYIPLVTLGIMFIVNSANLQDGLDGLLAGITSVSGVGYAFTALLMYLLAGGSTAQKDGLLCIAIFAMALCGGEMGFLRYNYFPAKVFHGDSGSMFMGGAFAGMALLMRQPFLLLFFAVGPICSSLSVILQRTYFKLTHGKRIFKMSPVHHHFEKCGWTEPQIDLLYWAVTGLLSLIAVLSVCGFRYGL